MNENKTVYLPTFFLDEHGQIIEKEERKNYYKKEEFYEQKHENRQGIEYHIYQRYVILKKQTQLELKFE